MTWADAKRLAREIARRKTTKARARQVQLWCEMVREVLRADMPVRAMPAGEPGAHLDAGTPGEMPGPLAVDPAPGVSA
jgi:hypothetical protein